LVINILRLGLSAIALRSASWLYRNSPLYALATSLLSTGRRSLRKAGMKVRALIDISAAIKVSFIDPVRSGRLTGELEVLGGLLIAIFISSRVG
jgi:hypothetical protein